MNIMNQITLKGLKKNKTRTIVTIIGIILSTAMITAVTTFASSIQNYILNYMIEKTGDWHAVMEINNMEYYEDIINDKRIKQASVVKSGGYSLFEGSLNEYKPYFYIMELDNKALDTLPIHLSEGRLPVSSNEVVISEHILSNGGVEFNLNDKIELEVGQRYSDDYELNQSNPYNHEQDGEPEVFKAAGSRSFTVVGICERFPYEIEGYSAPGYSIITKMDDLAVIDNANLNLSIYIKLNNPNRIYDLENEFREKYNLDNFIHNKNVIRYQGISDIDGFTGVLYGLATIIMVLIMVGSISLIYNSFSISVSERRKQFGLLSSVGATRKQLVNSVFFEALFIAIIGIPLGIGSGILGIGITLYLLKDNFSSMFGLGVPIELTLSVSLLSVVLAIILSMITILISAYIPARRAKKSSAIDAVRQTADYKLTAKNVKTSVLTRKIFGIEGDIALKNLKRNRKRYRSTVFSLFISVLLFISASSFSMYLTDSMENVYENYDYDLAYNFYEGESINEEHLKAYEDIKQIEGIDDASIVRFGYGYSTLAKEQVKEDFYSRSLDKGIMSDGEDMPITVFMYSVDHETFLGYIDGFDLKQEKFQKPNEITAIVVDKQHYFNQEEGRYNNTSIFKEQSEINVTVENYDENNNTKVPIVLGEFVKTTPLGIQDNSNNNTIMFIMDEEVINASDSKVKDLDWNSQFTMYFKSDNVTLAVSNIKKILLDAGFNNASIFNVAEQVEDNRNIIMIMNVFAYGFIVLMSLITIANVFNTISTNINLRRREFAMLKSVGITNHGFNKMLNYECIFYGLKSLLYGIPASIFVTYFIYKSIMQGVDITFYLPVNNILISIFSVFIVVFISMMYSMRKIRNENILDALKNENL